MRLCKSAVNDCLYRGTSVGMNAITFATLASTSFSNDKLQGLMAVRQLSVPATVQLLSLKQRRRVSDPTASPPTV